MNSNKKKVLGLFFAILFVVIVATIIVVTITTRNKKETKADNAVPTVTTTEKSDEPSTRTLETTTENAIDNVEVDSSIPSQQDMVAKTESDGTQITLTDSQSNYLASLLASLNGRLFASTIQLDEGDMLRILFGMTQNSYYYAYGYDAVEPDYYVQTGKYAGYYGLSNETLTYLAALTFDREFDTNYQPVPGGLFKDENRGYILAPPTGEEHCEQILINYVLRLPDDSLCIDYYYENHSPSSNVHRLHYQAIVVGTDNPEHRYKIISSMEVPE